MNPDEQMARIDMTDESGVTDHSLHNARVLISKYGIPTHIELVWDDDKWCLVKAEFRGYGEHVFTGFGWGYSGTGAVGLKRFLRLCKFNVKIDEIMKMRKRDPNPNVWIPKSLDEILS